MPITVTQKESLWKKILKKVEIQLSKDPHTYQAFFVGTKLINISDDKLTILAPSILCKSFLNTANPTSDILKHCVLDVTGKNYQLVFVLQDEIDTTVQVAPVRNENVPNNHTFFSNCKLNPKYTFDNFVVGDYNKEAVRASILVSNSPGVVFNPLFIYSKSGLGKTHLLHAIGNYYKEKYPSAVVLYITTDSFVDEYVKYVSGGSQSSNQSLRDFFKNVDILLVDDIQFLSDKTKTAEMFFYIFNNLINNGKQIILTSDRHPKDLKGLEERLVSRFNMGLSVNMQTPDTDTMLEILKRKIASHGLSVSNYDEDGLIFLAETFSKNVRELEGALNRLLFHTVNLRGDEKVTLEDIQEAVNIMMPSSDKKKDLNEEDIIAAVAKYYNISVDQIKSTVRTAQIALARRIAMYLCRFMLGSSYLKIGGVFKRDHSTVITGVDKVDKELKTDNQLAAAVNDIKKALKK